MDVTCERCGTEYEFDETLVSDRGTTVKCTNCGHLFKVFRPDADGLTTRAWQVETASGERRTIHSLKELQRLIAAGELVERDRISRGGEAWKRLGDIAELATFFASARGPVGHEDTQIDTASVGARPSEPDATAPDGPRPPPPRQGKGTILGVGNPPSESEPPPRRASAPPPRRGIGGSYPPAAAPPAPPARRATGSGEVPRIARPSDPAATAQARPRATAPAPVRRDRTGSEPPRPSGQARPLHLDSGEREAPPPRGRSRSGLWVLLVVLLATAVGVALGWREIAPRLGIVGDEEPRSPHADSGDAALALDHLEGYEQAVHHYTQALALDDHDPRALAGLARAHALWAQALLFDAADLEARAADDPERRGEASALRREAARHSEAALGHAEDAVRHASADPAAETALADAMRLNNVANAQSRLERALTMAPAPSAETLRVAALIDAANAGGDLAAARDRAEEAVSEDPGLLRARLLYARALLAARDVAAARRQVEAVLRRNARHPNAVALRDAIDQGRPPAPPTVEVPDAGVAPPATGAASPPPTAARSEPPTTTATTATATGAVPSGRDYSWYVRSGDERLERGDPQGARSFYEAARAIRSNGSEALTGLGYVALETGEANVAADKFRQAAGQGYAEAYIGLGSAYRRLGRTQDALTAYERYLERLPNGPRASIAQRQADELRRELGASGRGSDPPAGEPTGLPAPSNLEGPPPQDTPAIDSEP